MAVLLSIFSLLFFETDDNIGIEIIVKKLNITLILDEFFPEDDKFDTNKSIINITKKIV